MDQELLKKTKSAKKRKIAIAVILILFAVSLAVALKVTGGAGVLPAGNQTCTIEIRCDQLSEDMSQLTNKALEEYIPEDGVSLPETEYAFEEGATVFDALADTCEAKKIHLESKYDSLYQSYYVQGIGHLYEFDAGKRSGWMYTVDGESPEYGANQVELKGGEKIVWYYVTDYTY